MENSHPFQQENPDPKAFIDACCQWIGEVMPKSQEQLTNLRNKPETFWTSRARRIAVNHQTVLDCIHDLRARIDGYPRSTPGREDAIHQFDGFASTVSGIIKHAQNISQNGKSLATLKAAPPGIERLNPLILDLSEAATAAQNLMPVIKLISDNPETSRLEIVSIQLINEDIAELLSLAEAFTGKWKEGAIADEEQKLIGTAENMISILHTLNGNIKTFLGLSDMLANLKHGKPKHGSPE